MQSSYMKNRYTKMIARMLKAEAFETVLGGAEQCRFRIVVE